MSYAVHPYPTWFASLAARDLRHLDGYDLMRLVGSPSEMLANDSWSGMTMRWMDRVDGALMAAGATCRASNLLSAPPPLSLHLQTPSGDPMIGHVVNGDVPATLAALEVTVPGEEGEAVEQLRDWLRHCARRRADLVTFYF